MAPSKKTSSQRQRAAEKAEQILQGATQVFLAQGYDGASMDQVAKTAGVSKQTLYAYFSDKQALFSVLIERMATQRFQGAFGGQPLQGDPDVVLPRLAQSSLESMSQDTEYHDFIRLLISESKRFPDLVQVFFRSVTLPSIETLRDYLRAHPELDIPDPEATAHVLLGALVFYMLTQEIMGGKSVLPMTQERLGNSLLSLLGLLKE